MPRGSATLPGYLGLTQAELDDATDFTIAVDVKGIRITGPFLARTENGVISVKDGWLCQESNGRVHAVEDGQMGRELLVDVDVTTMGALSCPKVGVAYSQSIDTFPHDIGNNPVSFVMAAGFGLPTGLSMNSAGLITGTPPGPGGEGTYYFEVVVTFTDGTVTRQKVAMALFPATA